MIAGNRFAIPTHLRSRGGNARRSFRNPCPDCAARRPARLHWMFGVGCSRGSAAFLAAAPHPRSTIHAAPPPAPCFGPFKNACDCRRSASIALFPVRFAADARRSTIFPGREPSPQRNSSANVPQVPRTRVCRSFPALKLRERASVVLLPRHGPTNVRSSRFSRVTDQQTYVRRLSPGYPRARRAFVALFPRTEPTNARSSAFYAGNGRSFYVGGNSNRQMDNDLRAARFATGALGRRGDCAATPDRPSVFHKRQQRSHYDL